MRELSPDSNFHDRSIPEPLIPVGYAALIDSYDLKVPMPRQLSAIAKRHHPVSTKEWNLFSPRYQPDNTLPGHLEFAFKWEGIDLGVLAALFKVVNDDEMTQAIRREPTGAYTRRMWYLHEWLTGRQLDVSDPGKVRAVPIVNEKKQFAIKKGVLSSRHKVVDNLPGTRSFCPMVYRTALLEEFIAKKFHKHAAEIVGRTHHDVITRAAAFLLLNDSKASFQIEGEYPSAQRLERWGKVIAQAGFRSLSMTELERLQKIVIGDTRFVHLGLRREGGFVGMHDRRSQEPIPDHISARPEDLGSLVEGIILYDDRALKGEIDPVVAAASSAFGFVYIHPFEDGNGRLHRWLIHHILARAGYHPPKMVFPVSAAIHRASEQYRQVLESYSRPLLDFIEWEPTSTGNVRVLNDTGDYYRYFDATLHAEFLYMCVEQTVKKDLPEEIAYLHSYDTFSKEIEKIVDMPHKKINLLHNFLQQGNGHLSERAKSKEFLSLTEEETSQIENIYASLFKD
jgi:Fic family protein